MLESIHIYPDINSLAGLRNKFGATSTPGYTTLEFIQPTETKVKRIVGAGMDFPFFIKQKGIDIRKVLREFWKKQGFEITNKDVWTMIQGGGVMPAEFEARMSLAVERFIRERFRPTIAGAIGYAGNGSRKVRGMMDEINRVVGSDLMFDVASKRVVDYLEVQGAELVVQMSRSQINGLKAMLQTAARNDWTVGETTHMMKKGITLTGMESRAVANHYQLVLEKEIQRFLGFGKPTAIKWARKNAEFAAAKKTRFFQDVRANRISRTELKRAKTFADIEAHRQAIDAGYVENAYKTWRKGSFKDNWESSDLYDGKRIPVDQSFAQFGTPAYTTLTNFMGPGEINDLCFLEFDVNVPARRRR
jgi:hypothetical protein